MGTLTHSYRPLPPLLTDCMADDGLRLLSLGMADRQAVFNLAFRHTSFRQRLQHLCGCMM